ncbi:MAG: OadG family protein [Alphaproteobacteria bacterium]|nr:OadG family protein [Alphaproteobacteria bacterium]
MLINGVLITVLGMGAVFAFLLLLVWAVQLMSRLLQKEDADLTQVAATIAIALSKGESK